MINNKSCRICLIRNGSISVFEMHNDNCLAEMIESCANVKIIEATGMLNTICTDCVERVVIAYKFKKECEKSDLILKKIIEKQLNPETIICKSEESDEDYIASDTVEIILKEDFIIKAETEDDAGFSKNPYKTGSVESSTETANCYICEVCQKYFKSKYSLSRHLKTLHNSASLAGKLTEENPSSAKKLYETATAKIHTENESCEEIRKDYNCDRCQKPFKSKHTLSRHFKSVHNPSLLAETTDETNSEFECNICSKKFLRKAKLSAHKKRHGKKEYICEVCSKQFFSKYELERHQSIHNEDRPTTFKCEHCGKSFHLRQTLTSHLILHTGEKPYICNFCEKAFNSKSNLKQHVKNHTGDKRYICDVCNTSFISPYWLKVHKMIHTGERPYECEICLKRFIRLNSYNVHLLVHTTETPYQCEVCDKKFKSKRRLSIHKKIHTGAKPHKCSYCDNRYLAASNLRKHMRCHCKNRPMLIIESKPKGNTVSEHALTY